MRKIRGLTNILCLILTFFNTLYSQNLVPNPSFEECYKCPNKVNEFYSYKKHWSKPKDLKNWVQPTKGNFDYFNQCSKNIKLSTPKNMSGFQIPRTGNAYVGFCLYEGNSSALCNGSNYKEYIQVRLLKPLEKGEKYFVRLFYSYALLQNKATENTIGIYFSPDEINDKDCGTLHYIPQISHSDTNTISEAEIWLPLCGLYTALGGEKYITIGNFKSDEEIEVNKKGSYTYIYIDDVSVEKNYDDKCDCNVDSSKISIPFNSKIIANDSICNLFIKQLKIGSLYLLTHVSFQAKSSKMNSDTTNELKSLSVLLNKDENIEIEIYSHTDKMKNEEQSYELTTDRVKVVVNYLIRQGVSGKRIKYKGYGATLPVTKNNTSEEKEKNDRIEFRIIKL